MLRFSWSLEFHSVRWVGTIGTIDRRFHPPNGAGMGTVTPASGNGIDVSKGGPLIRQKYISFA
jgi:hypothetical protein